MDTRSERAWSDFKSRVVELGGVVLEEHWKGALTPHLIRCPEGHERAKRPAEVQQGGSLCGVCARGSNQAETKFLARIAELGYESIEGRWLGNKSPHRVRCPNGHEGLVRPNNATAWRGRCSSCGPVNLEKSRAAEARFRARVTELGGTVLEPVWLGNQKQHRVVCSSGHLSAVRPNNITQGSGLCFACAWNSQDVLYVVVDPVNHHVKFGITSGDPKPRLRAHRQDGFTGTVAVRQGLPAGRAFQVEQSLIKWLARMDVKPVRGREYFQSDCLGLILGFIDQATT